MTIFRVFWSDHCGSARSKEFEDMSEALRHTQLLRNESFRFVTMASEISEQVGKMGVDAVVDGKLPDGTDYTWKKRRI